MLITRMQTQMLLSINMRQCGQTCDQDFLSLRHTFISVHIGFTQQYSLMVLIVISDYVVDHTLLIIVLGRDTNAIRKINTTQDTCIPYPVM